jgi:AraC family transcriptional regulator
MRSTKNRIDSSPDHHLDRSAPVGLKPKLSRYFRKPLHPEENVGLSSAQLRYTTDYISANLHKVLNLELIATHLQLNYYYFCARFKKSMGISPWQYVIKQRIDRAQELLKNPQLSIAEVAVACGFSHHSQLKKHLRKLTGTTPVNYQHE